MLGPHTSPILELHVVSEDFSSNALLIIYDDVAVLGPLKKSARIRHLKKRWRRGGQRYRIFGKI